MGIFLHFSFVKVTTFNVTHHGQISENYAVHFRHLVLCQSCYEVHYLKRTWTSFAELCGGRCMFSFSHLKHLLMTDIKPEFEVKVE